MIRVGLGTIMIKIALVLRFYFNFMFYKQKMTNPKDTLPFPKLIYKHGSNIGKEIIYRMDSFDIE